MQLFALQLSVSVFVVHKFFTLHWRKGSLSGEWYYQEKGGLKFLLLRKGVAGRQIGQPHDNPACCQLWTRQPQHWTRWTLSPPICEIISDPISLPFHCDLMNSSSAATSAFPPQQGADATNYPKELGLCRLYHHSPLIAFPSCESCKALRLLHCYGNTVLCSYWNIQPTSIKYHNSQISAKYLSKERFSKANVLLALNKERGR